MQILSEILKAKEQRQTIRKGFAALGYATISFNFNIPGYPKSNELLKETFLLVAKELQMYLIASRVSFDASNIIKQHDEAGDICIIPIKEKADSLHSIKEDLEAFEANHILGRLLDVDVFDVNQNPISSGKKKACFLCDKPAIHCMHEGTHSVHELRAFINKQIQNYLELKRKTNICRRLSALATQSILLEVSLPGKPGLVCPESQGSHTDMNYLTFISSSAAITTYFIDIAELAYAWDGIRNNQILQKLRSIGLQMEQAMLESTHGVNTQKGIIFLMGFSVFVATQVLKTQKTFDTYLFRNLLGLLNKDIVSIELSNGWNKNTSHGEKCFNTYGKDYAGGIRQEIEQGLPTVFEYALPYMQELFADGFATSQQKVFHEKLLKVLIKIIAINNDTNILHRSDIQTLKELKEFAIKAMEFSETSYLMEYCKRKNISPGGSADLLAITLFIYQLKKEFKG
ncbi:MAG: triphosphoribosyl-dephospho-CoA synthase [Salinivirgaceae bacterium]|nr:triphosphoribosyl-dephospho-CoA synthase [Salinivirgaceae bacterium]